MGLIWDWYGTDMGLIWDWYKNKNKNKNKFISEQKMKFDDNEILLINILLETHTMGTTAIT